MRVDKDYFVQLLNDISYTGVESEYDFILSIYEFFIKRGFISEKQYDKLEEMKRYIDDPLDDDIPF